MRTLTAAIIFAILSIAASAADWHVKTTGTAGGNGSEASPWDLTTALNQPASLRAGDTVWVHGGTYNGDFTNNINGTSGAPIVIRAAAGERATIQGGMTYYGSYVWFRDLDLFAHNECFAPGLKLINCAVHDSGAGSGIDFWKGVIDGEINGCLDYNNGFDSDRGHGHGIYTQNDTGVKHIVDNIIFDMFGWGIHGYTQTGTVNNYDIQGNTVFNNGCVSVADNGFTENIIAYGNNPMNWTLANNYTFFSPGAFPGGNGGDNKLDIASGLTMTNNYFAGGASSMIAYPANNDTRTGNTFVGPVTGFSAANFPNNTYVASYTSLTGVKTFVRPNKYEKGRANVTIYNWSLQDSVAVDLSSSGLISGDAYEVRYALDYFGNPVATGAYSGAAVTIPMKGLSVAVAPRSLPRQPINPAPLFGAFVIRKTGAGSAGVYGDANGDGAFGMADINQMVDWLLGRSSPPASGTTRFTTSDVNGDNQLSMADLNLMVDRLLGRITKFPVEP
jgi:hypothetical protein